ncbi:MAG: chromate transporter [Phocaeicola sp.]|uniref:chromate transporter n=1 Tax=Phocaeicola sp. TaxID=2773926 RepID=UPI003FA0B25A
MIYLLLFYTFFKIGLFGFGGGYAMLSLIQGEVVTKYHWLSPSEFTDIVAISQMTPGPIGINSATYVGYTSLINAGYGHILGILGSITSTIAVVLPSFILMLIISKFFIKYQKHPYIEAVFSGLRPAIVGLIAAAALVLMDTENFGHFTNAFPNGLANFYQTNYQFIWSVLIFMAVFIGTRWLKVNPILMIVLCGVAGFILY